MNKFEFAKAFDCVWEKVQALNKSIDEEKPWAMAKNGENEKLEECLNRLITELLNINLELTPFIPDTCSKISDIFSDVIMPPKTPLFPK